MKIQQLAQELNVTRQAIFNKISRSGLSIADFTSGKQGKSWVLTEDGANRIRALMSGTGKKKQQDKSNESLQRIKKLQEDLQHQRKRADDLTELYSKAQQIMQTQAAASEAQIRMIEENTKSIQALNKTIQAQAVSLAIQTKTIEELQQKTQLLLALPVQGDIQEHEQNTESGSAEEQKTQEEEKKAEKEQNATEEKRKGKWERIKQAFSRKKKTKGKSNGQT